MKILIADDELPIREWLKMSMQNLDEGVNEVITAGNGKEAWNLFQETRPDLVVTDIKMPRMSGLELLSQIKADYPDTYVVMLTSYSEFEYAREAIKYKANEYLLKNEITAEVIEQIISNFNESRTTHKRLKEIQYIKNLLLDTEKTQKFPIKRIEGLDFFAVAFQEDESAAEGFDSYLNSFVQNIQHCYFEKNMSIWVCTYKNSYSMGACFGEAIGFCRHIALLKDTSIGFSGFTKEIPEACRRARIALNLSFYESHLNVYSYKEERAEGISKIMMTRKNAISMVNKERQEEAQEYIGELFKQIEKEQILDLDQIKACFLDIVDAYKVSKLEYAGYELEELCRQVKVGILDTVHLEELQREMDTFLGELKGTMVIGETSYSGYVKSAIAYVADNYANLESLSEVAVHVNIHADYFSRLFKSETGVTFNSYLTNYRIQKAVELLTKTDLKVYEVAEKTGYSNLSYFSRVFKKVTGVNPFFYKN